MTLNLLPIYCSAALIITTLALFARQNRRSGWKRERSNNLANALQEFYSDLGVVTEEMNVAAPAEFKPLTAEEVISFSAQMLTLRSALGYSAAVTQSSPVPEHELVRQ